MEVRWGGSQKPHAPPSCLLSPPPTHLPSIPSFCPLVPFPSSLSILHPSIPFFLHSCSSLLPLLLSLLPCVPPSISIFSAFLLFLLLHSPSHLHSFSFIFSLLLFSSHFWHYFK